MKKWKKVILIILAVLAILVAAILYFLPAKLFFHTEMTEVQFGDTIPFVMNGRHMLFKAEVNGKPDTLIYDSGVNSLMLMMYTPSTQPEGMKFYRNRVTGADKNSWVQSTRIFVKIEMSREYYFLGRGSAVLNPEPPLCEKCTKNCHLSWLIRCLMRGATNCLSNGGCSKESNLAKSRHWISLPSLAGGRWERWSFFLKLPTSI